MYIGEMHASRRPLRTQSWLYRPPTVQSIGSASDASVPSSAVVPSSPIAPLAPAGGRSTGWPAAVA
eukprot:4964634-Heterocapsa_arctica.AAC.1